MISDSSNLQRLLDALNRQHDKEQAMGQRLRASDVSHQLGDAGHTHSEWDGIDWDPGYRSVQAGPRVVHTFHDGPAEEHHLGLYTLALRNLGYSVVPDQMDGRGRHRLVVTKP